MTSILGLDIGTTSAKAVLFDLEGNVLAENEQPYPTLHPETGWAEQDPRQIEEATIAAIGRAVQGHSGELLGIGFSTAMHSLIAMDQDGHALSNAIIWADKRSTKEASDISSTVYLNTGTPLHPMSPLAKLKWMGNHEIDYFQQADYFVSVKEYLVYRWFGEKVVDYSMAAATGLFNIHDLTWDPQALAEAHISKDQLFEPVSPFTKLTNMDAGIAEQMGIVRQTPVVLAGSDGPLANLGIGAINPGETAITIGTSGAIRQFSSQPLIDSKQEIFSYAFTDDSWITGGPTNNGGIVLKWVQDLISNEHHEYSMDEMNQLAKSVGPGSDKLLFLPYLNGERAPFWDAQAKGSYIGLQPQHKKKHLIRASMEGVIFSIYHIGHVLERLGNEHKTLFASGGFARSSLWLQMLADTFGKPVTVPESHQSSAWGAAWVALCAVKGYKLEDIKSSIPMKAEIEPNLSNHQIYQEQFEIYQGLYNQLKETFRKLH